MRRYLLKRLVTTILVLLLSMIFLALLVHIVPGDAARTLLGPRATPELIAKVRAEMDLDKPPMVQVGLFIWKILHGSFGTDVFTGRPIGMLIGSALPHTIILAFSSLGLAVLLGIPL
ncbi:MAG: ABC transporter permease, partial [Anaerolineae bacterium]